MEKNTIIRFVKIIFLTTIIFIGCYFFYFLFFFKTTPTKIIKPSQETLVYTQNWNTYYNNEYNFKFRYPEDYSIMEKVDEISVIDKNNNHLFDFKVIDNDNVMGKYADAIGHMQTPKTYFFEIKECKDNNCVYSFKFVAPENKEYVVNLKVLKIEDGKPLYEKDSIEVFKTLEYWEKPLFQF